MRSYFLTIDEGKLEVLEPGNFGEEVKVTFELTAKGGDEFITYNREHHDDLKTAGFHHSSTVDFPEEYGAPEGFDFNAWVAGAVKRAEEARSISGLDKAEALVDAIGEALGVDTGTVSASRFTEAVKAATEALEA